MYTPKPLKRILGVDYSYNPPKELEDRYDLLIRYDMLDDLDSMVFDETLEITRYLQLFNKVSDEEKTTLFFEGVDIKLIDMLKGDLSEITPILFDRIKLYQEIYGGTIKDIMSRFISSNKLMLKVYTSYFEEGN